MVNHRTSGRIAGQFPQARHPLTQAYIMGARARDPATMRDSVRLAKILEAELTAVRIAQCKLAAEVLIERNET